jgi:4-hydroxy-tetrahydrodipicolinate synthase
MTSGRAAPRLSVVLMTNDTNRFKGIYASTIVPMAADGSIALDDLASHLRDMAACEGLRGLLINGHAGENAALTRQEARRVLEVARAEAPDLLIVGGINSENTAAAIELAEDAKAAGADAMMVFPPFSWALGLDPRAIVTHHRAIHDAVDLPLMLFQASVNSGRMNFDAALLQQLLQLERTVGIKEGSWESARYEATRRLSKSIRPDVAVMASGDEHLFTCFSVGSDGSLVSLAAVTPDLVVALDRAVSAGDLQLARQLNEQIYPLARAIYADAPGGLVSARLKACLVMLGRIRNGWCKAPVGPLSEPELSRLADALRLAHLEPDVSRALAAT